MREGQNPPPLLLLLFVVPPAKELRVKGKIYGPYSFEKFQSHDMQQAIQRTQHHTSEVATQVAGHRQVKQAFKRQLSLKH